MPTLRQVQDYINNRRKKIGDNNIPELKSFLDSIQYNTETLDNELFPFGIDLGTGSDESHFHLGFTSLKLLKNCEKVTKDNGIFHLDATYKIIKNSFPLIVLGVTDIKRQFFPICFMFSSHETEIDYDFFLKKS